MQLKFYSPHERTVNDLDFIYEELVHVKALSNLSSVVKRELSSVLLFEAHPYAGATSKILLLASILTFLIIVSI